MAPRSSLGTDPGGRGGAKLRGARPGGEWVREPTQVGLINPLIAGIGELAPTKREELARLGFRALIGGTLAALMTAAVAGILL